MQDLIRMLPDGASAVAVIIVVMLFLKQQDRINLMLESITQNFNDQVGDSQKAFQEQILRLNRQQFDNQKLYQDQNPGPHRRPHQGLPRDDPRPEIPRTVDQGSQGTRDDQSRECVTIWWTLCVTVKFFNASAEGIGATHCCFPQMPIEYSLVPTPRVGWVSRRSRRNPPSCGGLRLASSADPPYRTQSCRSGGESTTRRIGKKIPTSQRTLR